MKASEKLLLQVLEHKLAQIEYAASKEICSSIRLECRNQVKGFRECLELIKAYYSDDPEESLPICEAMQDIQANNG